MAGPSETDDPTGRPDPAPPGGRREPVRSGVGFSTAMAIVALMGLIAAIGGTIWATRPVRTPMQDCGSAAAFLLDGRVDVVGDPADPPPGLDAEDVEQNNAERCQERAAGRVRVGAVFVVSGLAVVAATALVESVVRGGWRLKRRSRRQD